MINLSADKIPLSGSIWPNAKEYSRMQVLAYSDNSWVGLEISLTDKCFLFLETKDSH